jgi:FlaA1/EpsC-like NDP-sugar epimerase
MITGAGGSIGSELCRQILAESPEQLLLVESSEYALYTIERELRELGVRRGYHARVIPLLGSVRDYAHMRMIIDNFAVDTVYHAAAYKHVPIVEHNVVEGVRNNVLGTVNLARAAADCSVGTFVLVSTDKAVRPSNIMGASKRISEMVMQAMAAAGGRTRFVIVRFGNVIDSSGSAIPLFRKQIQAGGPVTVTHLDAERYFMTIPEAAQLVVQASAMGSGGDVFVLNMGEPIRIIELARRMIHLAGMEVRDERHPEGDIEIRMIGLRDGEKMREELLMGNDVGATGHPMILRALEEFLPLVELQPIIQQLENACAAYDCARIRAILRSTVKGFDDRYGCSDPLAERLRANTPVESARVEHLFPQRVS